MIDFLTIGKCFDEMLPTSFTGHIRVPGPMTVCYNAQLISQVTRLTDNSFRVYFKGVLRGHLVGPDMTVARIDRDALRRAYARTGWPLPVLQWVKDAIIKLTGQELVEVEGI